MNAQYTTDNLSATRAYLAAPAHAKFVAATAQLRLAGSTPPWQATGLTVVRGQSYSLFARGQIFWSERYPGLFGGPRFHLWARITPGGRTMNMRSDTDTFIADTDGEIELCIYMGMWDDVYGNLRSEIGLYAPLTGHLDVVIAVYARDPAALFATLDASDIPAPLRHESNRHANPITVPPGWDYLLECGQAEIYRETRLDDIHRIDADASNDQGILRYPVDFPLSPDTTFSWQWRVDEHPSKFREDRAATHDYISVATEFDNGRDLTWIWSCCLDVGTHFACPVKAWAQRETHYVVRSATDTLGKWYTEHRNVYADVAATMGPPPARITAIWLITLTTFQHRRARASFSALQLADGQQRIRLLSGGD